MKHSALPKGSIVHILIPIKDIGQKRPANCITIEKSCYKVPAKVLKRKNDGTYILITRIHGVRKKYAIPEQYMITPNA